MGRDPATVTTTRIGTLILLHDTDEAARTRSFIGGAAGEGWEEQFTIGTADEVVAEIEQLVATGVDSLIFNMPLSDAETCHQGRGAAHRKLRVACGR